MALAPGYRLGPYEIVALLGAGGMGEVYRARDPRLDRDVAIKVLPAAFTADREYLRRFEQEARAVAALNHPNILAVYDVGEHQGAPYIVSELLEGETLRSRTSGPMPQRRAIEFAQQIARGLAAAHEKGIVHRDLKPENIFVRTDGSAKILDFGLAKLTEPHPLGAGANLSTLAQDTRPGAIMGTVGYMAPEQVRGEAADHRADIFAFGAILYEMLTGRRAFAKETSAETLTAILKEDPSDLTTFDRTVSPGLSRIVDRCLEKNAAARFQSTHDLGFALGQLDTTSGTAAPVRPAVPRASRWVPWALLALTALAWLTTSVLWRMTTSRGSSDAVPVRFQIQPPGPVSFTASGHYLAVSPDGRRIVFAAGAGGTRCCGCHSLNSLTATTLAGTERATQPFWSPDSEYIGFFADGKLRRISASRRAESTDLRHRRSAGRRGLEPERHDSRVKLQRSSDEGPFVRWHAGAASVLDRTGRDEVHSYPQFLPDGERFLFYVRSTDPDRAGIYVQSLGLDGRASRYRAESRFMIVPGYLVYGRDGLLMAQPFDAVSAQRHRRTNCDGRSDRTRSHREPRVLRIADRRAGLSRCITDGRFTSGLARSRTAGRWAPSATRAPTETRGSRLTDDASRSNSSTGRAIGTSGFSMSRRVRHRGSPTIPRGTARPSGRTTDEDLRGKAAQPSM